MSSSSKCLTAAVGIVTVQCKTYHMKETDANEDTAVDTEKPKFSCVGQLLLTSVSILKMLGLSF